MLYQYNKYNMCHIYKIYNCMHFLSKVEEFMSEADIDQNGKLDYDEFSRMLLREPSCDNWCIQIYKNVLWSVIYRVSLKKGSFRIPAPMEALGCSKGLDISQKHCQTSFFYTLSHDYMPTLYWHLFPNIIKILNWLLKSVQNSHW